MEKGGKILFQPPPKPLEVPAVKPVTALPVNPIGLPRSNAFVAKSQKKVPSQLASSRLEPIALSRAETALTSSKNTDRMQDATSDENRLITSCGLAPLKSEGGGVHTQPGAQELLNEEVSKVNNTTEGKTHVPSTTPPKLPTNPALAKPPANHATPVKSLANPTNSTKPPANPTIPAKSPANPAIPTKPPATNLKIPTTPPTTSPTPAKPLANPTTKFLATSAKPSTGSVKLSSAVNARSTAAASRPSRPAHPLKSAVKQSTESDEGLASLGSVFVSNTEDQTCGIAQNDLVEMSFDERVKKSTGTLNPISTANSRLGPRTGILASNRLAMKNRLKTPNTLNLPFGSAPPAQQSEATSLLLTESAFVSSSEIGDGVEEYMFASKHELPVSSNAMAGQLLKVRPSHEPFFRPQPRPTQHNLRSPTAQLRPPLLGPPQLGPLGGHRQQELRQQQMRQQHPEQLRLQQFQHEQQLRKKQQQQQEQWRKQELQRKQQQGVMDVQLQRERLQLQKELRKQQDNLKKQQEKFQQENLRKQLNVERMRKHQQLRKQQELRISQRMRKREGQAGVAAGLRSPLPLQRQPQPKVRRGLWEQQMMARRQQKDRPERNLAVAATHFPRKVHRSPLRRKTAIRNRRTTLLASPLKDS